MEIYCGTAGAVIGVSKLCDRLAFSSQGASGCAALIMFPVSNEDK